MKYHGETYSEDVVRWAAEYHRNVATEEDRVAVAEIDGDPEQVVAWYWDAEYRMECDYLRKREPGLL